MKYLGSDPCQMYAHIRSDILTL